MTTGKIIRVALALPTFKLYDYLAPDSDARVEPGMRVRVPFGRQRRIGIATESRDDSDVDGQRLRRIEAVIDTAPLFSDELMSLAQWASRYYQHPLGEVFDAMLPERLRAGESATSLHEEIWKLTDSGAGLDPSTTKRAPRQTVLLGLLRAAGDAGLPYESLRDACSQPRSVLRQLEKRGWVVATRGEPRMPMLERTDEGPAPSDEQDRAVDALCRSGTGYSVSLLQGVTGSGKTEVYIRAMQPVLERGQQVLVLVPEIGLTPQLVGRIQARLGCAVAVLHSGLSAGQRLHAWQAARQGTARIVLGTRSAVFVPLANPGLFILDEEHDLSLKQQEGFRYSARDLLIVRARTLGIPVVLGSATPSLESLRNVDSGRYQHLRLSSRAGEAELPTVRLLDTRNEPMQEGLSRALLHNIERHLSSGGQVMLFINRRGFAPIMRCNQCGWTAGCHRCDLRLVFHQRKQELRCHHCGHRETPPSSCPKCGTGRLFHAGHGTERLEVFLGKRFPDFPTVRIDRDTTRRKGSMQALLSEVRSGAASIIIGTQMLAKGHDLPGITLAAIIDADQGLFGTDFRAGERLAQLIVQVSGRAGRGRLPGEVLVQTDYPDHPLFEQVLHEGYSSYARQALDERNAAGFPPYQAMAMVRAEAATHGPALEFLSVARDRALALDEKIVEIHDPLPAPVERLKGRYRAQLLLMAPNRSGLQRLLQQWVPGLAELPLSRRVRWSVDVDPQEMF